MRSRTGSGCRLDAAEEDHAHRHGSGEAGHDRRRRPSPGRSLGDAQHQRGQGRADQEHAQIVRGGPGGGRSGLVEDPPAHQPRHHTDGHVDHEDPAPAAGGDEGGTEGGPGGHGQRPDPAPQRHHLGAPLGGEGPEQQSEGGGQQARRTDALDDPAEYEERHRGGQGTQGRAQAEHTQAGEEHPAAAHAVGRPPRRHQQGAEDDAVAGDHPSQRGPAVVGEGVLEGGEGHIDDGQIEGGHERPEGGDHEDGPLAARGHGRDHLVYCRFRHATDSRRMRCIMQLTTGSPRSGILSPCRQRRDLR